MVLETDTCQTVPENFPTLVLFKVSVSQCLNLFLGWAKCPSKRETFHEVHDLAGRLREGVAAKEKSGQGISENFGVYPPMDAPSHYTAKLHRPPARATAREDDHRSARLRRFPS
jgi:hypothetical protein